MPQRNKFYHRIGVLLACCGVLAPLSVAYQEVRALVRQDRYPEGERIAEFERFRDQIGHDRVTLVEPDDIAAIERYTRFLLAQYALAPAIVSGAPLTGTRLVNREARSAAAAGRTEAEQTHYILQRD